MTAVRLLFIGLLCLLAAAGRAQTNDLPELGDPTVAVLSADQEHRLGRSWLRDLRGQPDLFGRRLETSELGFADEIAAAASLMMGQAAEGRPVVIVRGLDWSESPQSAANLVRPVESDLFR